MPGLAESRAQPPPVSLPSHDSPFFTFSFTPFFTVLAKQPLASLGFSLQLANPVQRAGFICNISRKRTRAHSHWTSLRLGIFLSQTVWSGEGTLLPGEWGCNQPRPKPRAWKRWEMVPKGRCRHWSQEEGKQKQGMWEEPVVTGSPQTLPHSLSDSPPGAILSTFSTGFELTKCTVWSVTFLLGSLHAWKWKSKLLRPTLKATTDGPCLFCLVSLTTLSLAQWGSSLPNLPHLWCFLCLSPHLPKNSGVTSNLTVSFHNWTCFREALWYSSRPAFPIHSLTLLGIHLWPLLPLLQPYCKSLTAWCPVPWTWMTPRLLEQNDTLPPGTPC